MGPIRTILRLTATALCVAGIAVGEELPPTGELIQERRGHAVAPRTVAPTPERIARLRLPEGFRIGVFASGLGKPRMFATAPDGTLYATRRDAGDVVALRDADGDGSAEVERAVALPGAHGIAVHDGTMYLATVDAVYAAAIADGGAIGEPRRILDGLPPGGRHPNRTLGMGPDGWLYVTIGSTCNCCIERHEESAAIIRVRPDGSGREIFARGLRNTLGFGWHPRTQAMWGMDHGSDWLGDTVPPEELNLLEAGKHYGWPFVYGDGEVIDIRSFPVGFDRERWVRRNTPPALTFHAHAAPLQLAFYTGTQFPEEYRGDAFVAMHGSWNRKPPIGYEVLRIRFDDAGRPRAFETFLTGFLLDGPTVSGRPCGIAVAQDGALLVGDDTNGMIYRVSWRGG